MELKHTMYSKIQNLAVRFNRTFMELKRRTPMCAVLRINGFNRTFMELKLDTNPRKTSNTMF